MCIKTTQFLYFGDHHLPLRGLPKRTAEARQDGFDRVAWLQRHAFGSTCRAHRDPSGVLRCCYLTSTVFKERSTRYLGRRGGRRSTGVGTLASWRISDYVGTPSVMLVPDEKSNVVGQRRAVNCRSCSAPASRCTSHRRSRFAAAARARRASRTRRPSASAAHEWRVALWTRWRRATTSTHAASRSLRRRHSCKQLPDPTTCRHASAARSSDHPPGSAMTRRRPPRRTRTPRLSPLRTTTQSAVICQSAASVCHRARISPVGNSAANAGHPSTHILTVCR